MSTTESASPAPAPEPTQEPAPKKSSIGKRILTYIVGLIVVGGAFYAFNYFSSDVAQAKVGDCAAITGTSTSPEYKQVDCGVAEANYTVAKAGGTSDACEETATTSTRRRSAAARRRSCASRRFSPRASATARTAGIGLKAVECSGAGAMKVTKVVKEAAAPQCAEGEQACRTPRSS